ncbi:hypothetical protein AXF42_Ash006357 [Apostasia shenzhenica]|uniref:Uncharacterized protein n=1 Tax=Apostasia shenzhenica TaxID=1088818 RepID=A0A2I0AYU1_9ASPA|nr:hypothetical protein AXF42_Ash006357 [Apostasia shenzhenica]
MVKTTMITSFNSKKYKLVIAKMSDSIKTSKQIENATKSLVLLNRTVRQEQVELFEITKAIF